MRIILTGFTDVEDLVEAINSGQVYKYITKPWDPNELKLVVQRAAETYELLKLRTEELHRAQTQMALLNTISDSVQQPTDIKSCLQTIANAYTQVSVDACVLSLLEGQTLGIQAVSGDAANISQDPLVQSAVTTAQFRVAANIAADEVLASLPHYAEAGIQSHLVLPVLFQNSALAVLSLQWKQPQILSEEELSLMQLAAQQVGIALTCVHRQPASQAYGSRSCVGLRGSADENCVASLSPNSPHPLDSQALDAQTQPEAAQIQALFNRIAPDYDRLNDWLSLGQHRVWKQMAVSWSGATVGAACLDICCGSGDLARLLARRVGLWTGFFGGAVSSSGRAYL
jgi:CheY-like chemotaxis protein